MNNSCLHPIHIFLGNARNQYRKHNNVKADFYSFKFFKVYKLLYILFHICYYKASNNKYKIFQRARDCFKWCLKGIVEKNHYLGYRMVPMILIFRLWERIVTSMITSRQNVCRISPDFLRMEYYLLYIFNDRRDEYQKSPRWKVNNSGSCWQMVTPNSRMHQLKNAISCIHVSDNLTRQLERSPHKSHSSVLLLSRVAFLQAKGPSLGSASNPLPLATTCSSFTAKLKPRPQEAFTVNARKQGLGPAHLPVDTPCSAIYWENGLQRNKIAQSTNTENTVDWIFSVKLKIPRGQGVST